jgi:hypothetical protein
MGKIERIEVRAEDRERLERLVRDRNTPQKIVWRSQIVLLAGEGMGAVEVAARWAKGCSPCGAGGGATRPRGWTTSILPQVRPPLPELLRPLQGRHPSRPEPASSL